MKLADLQQHFQDALLTGDREILRLIPDSPREIKETLFQVYADAYVIRLVAVLKDDYEKLCGVMGGEAFDVMARAYIAANPSRFRSARHVGGALAPFLRHTAPYSAHPALSDLAELEAGMNDAFDAGNAEPLTLATLAATPAQHWGELVFTMHPSARLLGPFHTNALAQWQAVAETSPCPEANAEPAYRLLVWRQGLTVRYRRLEAEEAMLWREAQKGASFGALCELTAIYGGPDEAPRRAATYLKGWIDTDVIAQATLVSPRLSPQRQAARE